MDNPREVHFIRTDDGAKFNMPDGKTYTIPKGTFKSVHQVMKHNLAGMPESSLLIELFDDDELVQVEVARMGMK